jgi:exopolyphosphatase / guanosine-5'-triphosphate,3'-diphosphate pyrophosphatase
MVNSMALVGISASSEERNRIIAAIDLGTNSLHMVIVRVDPKLPTFTIIAREKETVRLGDRNLETGELKEGVMKRAITALRRFQEIAKTLNVEEIIAVATSAIREAPNGRDFLVQIEEQLGLAVSLISGQEEARRIYLGVLSGMGFNNRPHVIIDIGGGSTELVLGDGQDPRFLSSSKVGAVRLTSEFIKTDPISNSEFQSLQAFVRGTLERPVDELRALLNAGEQARLVGTSGTIETVANIIAREKTGAVPSPLTGYQLMLKDLRDLVNRLRKLTYAERLAIPGMNDRRSEIILAGALILQEAMVLLGVDSLTVCERSLREGVIVDWMLTHGLIEDRLRYQSSVRQRSVLKIARKYDVFLEYADRIAMFAVSLFDQTQGIFHGWGVQERELLWAGAILHNCGIHVSHSSHHKHSYYLIRNGELLGYTEREIDVIANLARYHRKSPPKKKHENYRTLASKQSRLMVSQLSAMLRLAVALDRRQIGAVKAVKCEFKPEIREFRLFLVPQFDNDDCVLELWSLDLKKEVFEAEFNVRVVAKLEQPVGVEVN